MNFPVVSISALGEAMPVSGDEVLPIAQGGVTRRLALWDLPVPLTRYAMPYMNFNYGVGTDHLGDAAHEAMFVATSGLTEIDLLAEGAAFVVPDGQWVRLFWPLREDCELHLSATEVDGEVGGPVSLRVSVGATVSGLAALPDIELPEFGNVEPERSVTLPAGTRYIQIEAVGGDAWVLEMWLEPVDWGLVQAGQVYVDPMSGLLWFAFENARFVSSLGQTASQTDDPPLLWSLSLGLQAVAAGDGLALGRASTAGERSVALGAGAKATHEGSVALGARTATTNDAQVMVGDRNLELLPDDPATANRGIIMQSPDGTRWMLTVDNAGGPVFTDLT